MYMRHLLLFRNTYFLETVAPQNNNSRVQSSNSKRAVFAGFNVANVVYQHN
jgi:hypothetical protein